MSKIKGDSFEILKLHSKKRTLSLGERKLGGTSPQTNLNPVSTNGPVVQVKQRKLPKRKAYLPPSNPVFSDAIEKASNHIKKNAELRKHDKTNVYQTQREFFGGTSTSFTDYGESPWDPVEVNESDGLVEMEMGWQQESVTSPDYIGARTTPEEVAAAKIAGGGGQQVSVAIQMFEKTIRPEQRGVVPAKEDLSQIYRNSGLDPHKILGALRRTELQWGGEPVALGEYERDYNEQLLDASKEANKKNLKGVAVDELATINNLKIARGLTSKEVGSRDVMSKDVLTPDSDDRWISALEKAHEGMGLVADMYLDPSKFEDGDEGERYKKTRDRVAQVLARHAMTTVPNVRKALNDFMVQGVKNPPVYYSDALLSVNELREKMPLTSHLFIDNGRLDLKWQADKDGKKSSPIIDALKTLGDVIGKEEFGGLAKPYDPDSNVRAHMEDELAKLIDPHNEVASVEEDRKSMYNFKLEAKTGAIIDQTLQDLGVTLADLKGSPETADVAKRHAKSLGGMQIRAEANRVPTSSTGLIVDDWLTSHTLAEPIPEYIENRTRDKNRKVFTAKERSTPTLYSEKSVDLPYVQQIPNYKYSPKGEGDLQKNLYKGTTPVYGKSLYSTLYKTKEHVTKNELKEQGLVEQLFKVEPPTMENLTRNLSKQMKSLDTNKFKISDLDTPSPVDIKMKDYLLSSWDMLNGMDSESESNQLLGVLSNLEKSIEQGSKDQLVGILKNYYKGTEIESDPLLDMLKSSGRDVEFVSNLHGDERSFLSSLSDIRQLGPLTQDRLDSPVDAKSFGMQEENGVLKPLMMHKTEEQSTLEKILQHRDEKAKEKQKRIEDKQKREEAAKAKEDQVDPTKILKLLPDTEKNNFLKGLIRPHERTLETKQQLAQLANNSLHGPVLHLTGKAAQDHMAAARAQQLANEANPDVAEEAEYESTPLMGPAFTKEMFYDKNPHLQHIADDDDKKDPMSAWARMRRNYLTSSGIAELGDPEKRDSKVKSLISGALTPTSEPAKIDKGSIASNAGDDLEPKILDYYKSNFDSSTFEPGMMTNVDKPGQATTPDAVAKYGQKLVEVKTRGTRFLDPNDPMNKPHENETLRKNFQQIQHQMYITGMKETDMLEVIRDTEDPSQPAGRKGFIEDKNFRIRNIKRDEEFISRNREDWDRMGRAAQELSNVNSTDQELMTTAIKDGMIDAFEELAKKNKISDPEALAASLRGDSEITKKGKGKGASGGASGGGDSGGSGSGKGGSDKGAEGSADKGKWLKFGNQGSASTWYGATRQVLDQGGSALREVKGFGALGKGLLGVNAVMSIGQSVYDGLRSANDSSVGTSMSARSIGMGESMFLSTMKDMKSKRYTDEAAAYSDAKHLALASGGLGTGHVGRAVQIVENTRGAITFQDLKELDRDNPAAISSLIEKGMGELKARGIKGYEAAAIMEQSGLQTLLDSKEATENQKQLNVNLAQLDMTMKEVAQKAADLGGVFTGTVEQGFNKANEHLSTIADYLKPYATSAYEATKSVVDTVADSITEWTMGESAFERSFLDTVKDLFGIDATSVTTDNAVRINTHGVVEDVTSRTAAALKSIDLSEEEKGWMREGRLTVDVNIHTEGTEIVVKKDGSQIYTKSLAPQEG